MKKLLFLMVLSALMCNSLKAQNLHRVNNNADFDAAFTTLQAAVTAAANNDTIYVEGSATEYAGATINKPLTIVGPGFFLDENPFTQASNTATTFNSEITFTSGSEGSTIMGCKFLYSAYLNINASDISVIRNYLYSIALYGTINNTLVAQNYVYDVLTVSNETITNTIISNNIIRGQIYFGDLKWTNSRSKQRLFYI